MKFTLPAADVAADAEATVDASIAVSMSPAIRRRRMQPLPENDEYT
jgi:hypothetical protein